MSSLHLKFSYGSKNEHSEDNLNPYVLVQVGRRERDSNSDYFTCLFNGYCYLVYQLKKSDIDSSTRWQPSWVPTSPYLYIMTIKTVPVGTTDWMGTRLVSNPIVHWNNLVIVLAI